MTSLCCRSVYGQTLKLAATRDDQFLKRSALFWLLVSEVSSHEASVFYARGSGACHTDTSH